MFSRFSIDYVVANRYLHGDRARIDVFFISNALVCAID